jgi:asparagine synthase (glutamine-hydrolysing)
MCGICGIIGPDAEVVDAATHRMMRAMPHRGPDDEGFERLPLGSTRAADIWAGLGFRRLAILDLSLAGHQPMFDHETGNCLVFNGEIYNFKSVRAKLESKGVGFHSTGDTEVLLKALTTWGEGALDEIDGMFALAFYEAKSRRILLARDPVGIKPLYYARAPRTLIFASEVRTLLASGLISDEFDPAGVASFLAYGAPQDPLTVHKAIKSFPCGTYQWIRAAPRDDDMIEGARVEYWRMPSADPTRRPDEAAASLRDALERTVREHLTSDVPLAFFLSGGVDSAVIAALAARTLGTVETFCVGFDSPGMKSELNVAEITARLIGAHHHQVIVTRESIVDTWDRWLSAADRPSVDGLNTFIISGAVRAANAKVAFSGLGADEIFGGYGNFFRVPRLLRVARIAAFLPLRLRQAMVAALLPLVPKRYRLRFKMLAAASANPVDICLSLKQMLDGSTLRQLGFEPSALSLDEHFLDEGQTRLCGTANSDVFRAVSCVETRYYMGNTLLRDSDTNSMAHSIELRVPFVGRRILEEAGLTPGTVHLGGGHTPKKVLRDAVGDLLAPEVLDRKKTGFTLPLGDWMFDQLRDSCEAGIDGLAAVPFINQDGARRLWQQLVDNQRHGYWMKPFLLVALGTYADRCRRTYLDTSGALKVRPPRTRLV